MNIGILGGGIVGLSCAYHLATRGHQCTLIDGGEQLGGVLQPIDVDGTKVDRFYHTLLYQDQELRSLFGELGIIDHFRQSRTRSAFVKNNRVYSVSAPTDMLRFDVLNFWERMRFGWVTLGLKKSDWRELDQLDSESWIRAAYGASIAEKFFLPQMRGKFDTLDQHGAVDMWARIVRYSGSRDRKMSEIMGYLKGGLGVLITGFEDWFSKNGVRVSPGAKVRSMNDSGNRVSLEFEDDSKEEYDCVVSTVQPNIMAKVVGAEWDDYKRQLLQIPYQANTCLILKTKQILAEYYTMSFGYDAPMTAVVGGSHLYPAEEFGGSQIYYISKYSYRDKKTLNASAEELLETYWPHLLGINPDFDRNNVEACVKTQTPYGEPFRTKGYLSLIPPLRTPMKNVYHVVGAQLYPEITVIYTLFRHAGKMCEEILEELQ